jgi:hypothetical protein
MPIKPNKTYALTPQTPTRPGAKQLGRKRRRQSIDYNEAFAPAYFDGEHIVVLVCPYCAGRHRHGAPATAGEREAPDFGSRGAHCISGGRARTYLLVNIGALKLPTWPRSPRPRLARPRGIPVAFDPLYQPANIQELVFDLLDLAGRHRRAGELGEAFVLMLAAKLLHGPAMRMHPLPQLVGP